jgi:four helix bundle protein
VTITRFEEIKSWQEARSLTSAIYVATREGDFSRDYCLRDQVRRASVSIMANIAEGFGRSSRREFAQFLGIANGSALEVQSHLYVARDLGYIDAAQFEALMEKAHAVSRLIGGMINHLNKTLETS